MRDVGQRREGHALHIWRRRGRGRVHHVAGVKGDVDLPRDTLRAALEAGEAEGFSSDIPPEAFGNFGNTDASAVEQRHLPAGPSVGMANAVGDAIALAVAAGDAKAPAASKEGETVVNSAENQDAFLQAKNLLTKQLLEDAAKGTVDPQKMLLPMLMQVIGPTDSKASSLQAQAESETSAKNDAEPCAKQKPKPKPKSPEQTLFAECSFEGKNWMG